MMEQIKQTRELSKKLHKKTFPKDIFQIEWAPQRPNTMNENNPQQMILIDIKDIVDFWG